MSGQRQKVQVTLASKQCNLSSPGERWLVIFFPGNTWDHGSIRSSSMHYVMGTVAELPMVLQHPNFTGLPTSCTKLLRGTSKCPKSHKNSPKTMDGMGFILGKIAIVYSPIILKFTIQVLNCTEAKAFALTARRLGFFWAAA